MHTRLAIVALALLAIASCTDNPSDENDAGEVITTQRPLPSGLSYYRSPGTRPDLQPGSVVSTEPITLDGITGTGFRITYSSTTPADDTVHLTGVAIVPTGVDPDSPAAEGLPVAVWAHPTVGIGTECAPSLVEPFPLAGAQQLLDAGFIVMAPDYDGLGSDGVHPYLVSESEGRAVLDIARAAADFGGSEVVVSWGHSQGGHAALAARAIASRYAPDIDLRSVAAASPPTDLAAFLDPGFDSATQLGITAQTVVSWATVYENTGFEQFGTADAVAAASAALESCFIDIAAVTVELDPSAVWATDPAAVPAWESLTAYNSIDPADGTSPVFITHGGDDTLVPISGSQALVDGLCDNGVAVQYRTEPEWTHGSAYSEPLPEILDWLTDTARGVASGSSC